MKVETGAAEEHPTPLPLNSAHSPAVAPPTPVAGQLTPADQGGVMPATAMNLEQQRQGAADVAAAMSAGMQAEGDRRSHYQAQALPEGGQIGDDLVLPVVPAASVPPAQSDDYPYSGTEPTPAAAGFSGVYGGS